jgi:hypothetical protein
MLMLLQATWNHHALPWKREISKPLNTGQKRMVVPDTILLLFSLHRIREAHQIWITIQHPTPNTHTHSPNEFTPNTSTKFDPLLLLLLLLLVQSSCFILKSSSTHTWRLTLQQYGSHTMQKIHLIFKKNPQKETKIP